MGEPGIVCGGSDGEASLTVSGVSIALRSEQNQLLPEPARRPQIKSCSRDVVLDPKNKTKSGQRDGEGHHTPGKFMSTGNFIREIAQWNVKKQL